MNRMSSINVSTSNNPESAGRSFATPFSAQSGAASAAFHHTGNVQGLHNAFGGYNIPNMTSALASRNTSTGGVQQPSGGFSGGRFSSNNLPIVLSQQISHGHSGVVNRGMNVVGNPGYGSSTSVVGGILPGSSAVGNRNGISGLGVSPILGSGGNRISNSVGNMISARTTASGGVSSARLNLSSTNPGSPSLSNRLINGVLPQASPQVISMLGNSYASGGPFSQNHVQNMSNLLNDMNESSPFDINDFPQLTARPGSAGGPQPQLGGLRKQGLSVSPIVQQSQEFSIQNEDFPALPQFKGTNADYALDPQQPKHPHPGSAVFPMHMGRSTGFGLVRPPAQHGQDVHFPSADMFRSYPPPGIGMRTPYDQLVQQQYRLQQSMKAAAAVTPVNPYGLLGLLSVIRTSDVELKSLALGIDLTTLGLNLNSSDDLHKTFASPWSDEPAKGDADFTVPACYFTKPPPLLHQGYFSKFRVETLFYAFYSMPGDDAQLYAANELYNRGWFYYTEHRLWLVKVSNSELAKQTTYERGSYLCFDPNTWETVRKDNFVVQYDMVEKRPCLPLPHH